ncbi:spore germination protein GerW family protein [Halegenticoccus tardaugens]|uniref:spore germination protein GerW family protein n=1 Tax=Halegenticoccus tardaugens TaxID=2071624 RepID=UPI00100A2E83|nr:spore germination protein GerW family protein [Halegenticoccus tardaugens]
MNAAERFLSIVERLTERGSVRSVFGEPILSEGRTTVPVAKVAYGFGGGFGTDGRDRPADERAGDAADEIAGDEGGGVGGGVSVTPLGVLEITEDRIRFVRFDDRRRTIAAATVGAVVGFLAARRFDRRPD